MPCTCLNSNDSAFQLVGTGQGWNYEFVLQNNTPSYAGDAGRKKVYDSISNRIIRLFPQDLEAMVAKGIIINEFKRVSKFHNVNYIKIK